MWNFRSPHIVFGEDAINQLSEISGIRAFIVTDPVMVSLGFLQQVENRLIANKIESDFFAEVEPDPCLETVQRCASLMQTYEPDLVIGLGGGSCLDAAKAAWLLYECPDINLEGVSPFEHFGLGAKARFITIPTTAGSGAEVTGGAVIKDSGGARKMEIPTYEFLPHVTIVDPQFSSRMPKELTADTGIDVLTHAVEGYSSTFANDFSDGMCLQAAWMVFTYLPRAYEYGGQDQIAREKMANAATIAGLGMGSSHIALAHVLGHSAGAVFGIPHGRITGCCLPYTIEYTANAGLGRYLGLARIIGLAGQDENQSGYQLAAAFRDLLTRLNMPLSVSDAGIPRDEFDAKLEVACDLAEMDSGLVTSRRFPYRDELKRLFVYIYEGKSIDF